MQVDTVKLALPLKRKFVISQGAAEVKTNLFTVLNNRYSGEAAGSVYYGPSIEVLKAETQKGITHINGLDEITLAAIASLGTIGLQPAACSALTGMLINYLSGESGRYPWEILDIGVPVGVKSSYTVGIDDPKSVMEQIASVDHSIIKLKLGSENDAEVIEALRAIEGKEIRVDANGGWTPDVAEERIHYLAEAGVKIIEQPTSLEHIKDWPFLKNKREDLELILDEGLGSVEDYNTYAQYCDGVNIKMEKSGGIIEAVKIAQRARKAGRKIMLGCMVSSSVAIAQSLYMSSLADYYDLDGPQLLDEDIASGISYFKESIEVDQEIIGGPKLRREVFEKYIQS